MEINPQQTQYEYLVESCKGWENEPALTFSNCVITYGELLDSIDVYSRLLKSKGIGKDDKVGICTFNTPEAVYLVYALSKIGAVRVGLSPFDKTETLKADIELTRPKMVITTDYSFGGFKKLKKSLDFQILTYSPVRDCPMVERIFYNAFCLKSGLGNFSLSKSNDLHSLLNRGGNTPEAQSVPYQGEVMSDIMFTGGTLSNHKGAMLTDYGLNFQIEGMKKRFPEGFFDGKVYLGQIPLGPMAFGRSIMHAALTTHMTYALTLNCLPKDFYGELVRTKANGASGGPPHWGSLFEITPDKEYVPRKNIVPDSLSNLQVAFSGGEELLPSVEAAINRVLKYAGAQTHICNGLGATETFGSIILCLVPDQLYKVGQLGLAIPGQKIILLDPNTHEPVSVGEIGEAHISGPSVMLGYYNNPEATNRVLTRDEKGERTLNLQDQLSIDSNGIFTFRGRTKRQFVSGCTNIYPEDIEAMLVKELPEIKECAIVPVQVTDASRQNMPCYFISIYPSIADTIDLEDFERRLKIIVRDRIGEDAIPNIIEYSSEGLLKTPNAKINIGYYKSKGKELYGKRHILSQNQTI